jgi:hypothetical protein
MWSLGWAKASQLSPLDFDDPNSRHVPFVKAARDYFYSRVRHQHGFKDTKVRESYGPEGHDRRGEFGAVSGTVRPTSADQII